MKSLKKNIMWAIGKIILPTVLTVLLKSLKYRMINGQVVHELVSKNQNYVVAFWHGKMTAGWYLNRKRNFAALISRSNDGEILSNILKKWEIEAVRGSSHKGGKDSLNILLDKIDNNYSIAITPDGPTGPPAVMKPGAVILAKKKNIPLVLMGIAYSKKITLRSWDSFELPKPFSTVYIKYSEPILVDSGLSYDETDKRIKIIGERLTTVNNEVEELC